MVKKTRKELVAEANSLLAQAGYKPDGRPTTAKRGSVRAISTPCGGRSGFRRH